MEGKVRPGPRRRRATWNEVKMYSTAKGVTAIVEIQGEIDD